MNSLKFVSLGFSCFFVFGCVALSEKAAATKIVEPIALTNMESCKDKGEFSAASDMSAKTAYMLLRNKSAKAGANIIVSRMRITSTADAAYKVTGRTFDCPPEIYNSLKAADLKL